MTTDQITRRQPTPTAGRAAQRGVAAAFVLGGALLGLAVSLHALEPVGCVGELECANRTMRSASTLTAVLSAAALALLLIGVAGVVLLGRRAGRMRGLGSAGALCMLAGGGSLVAAVAMQELAFGGDASWMPWVVLPAMLAVIIGIVLLAAWAIRSQVLPPWLGVLLAASGATLLAANEQTALVLLALPLAATMVLIGIALGRSPLEPA